MLKSAIRSMFGRPAAPRVHGQNEPHQWEDIRRGFPQKLCRCGAIYSPGGLKAGKNTVTMGPGGSDVVRWNSNTFAISAGDIGMDTASGRPNWIGTVGTSRLLAQTIEMPMGYRAGHWWNNDPGTTTVRSEGTSAVLTENGSKSLDGTGGQGLFYTSAAVAGSDAGWISPFTIITSGQHLWVAFTFLTGANITNIRHWIGIFSGNPMASATPALEYIAIRYDTSVDGTAFWRICGDNGSGAPQVITTTVSIAAGTYYLMVIDTAFPSFTNASVHIGNANQVNTSIDVTGNLNTKFPAALTNLGFCMQVRTLDAVAKSIENFKMGATRGFPALV